MLAHVIRFLLTDGSWPALRAGKVQCRPWGGGGPQHPQASEAVRGKGLFNAVIIQHPDTEAAYKLCLKLKENGLLAKPTHGDKIRFAPPLLISKEQIIECVGIIAKSLQVLN